jgi:hypothetical protein
LQSLSQVQVVVSQESLVQSSLSSQSESFSHGVGVGDALGVGEGDAVGVGDGEGLGLGEGDTLGLAEGVVVGRGVGDTEGGVGLDDVIAPPAFLPQETNNILITKTITRDKIKFFTFTLYHPLTKY